MTSWESELRASGITARSVRLTWSVDLFASASPAEYIIAFRTTNTITLSETSVSCVRVCVCGCESEYTKMLSCV